MQANPPTFRPATTADLDTILAFNRQLYAQDHIPTDAATIRASLAELLRQPAFGGTWLIERNREPLGYLVLTYGFTLEYGGRDAFVDELFVRADARGQGLGTAALDFAAQVCRDLGIRALHLEVDHANEAAKRLYRRWGFVDHDRYLMTRRVLPA